MILCHAFILENNNLSFLFKASTAKCLFYAVQIQPLLNWSQPINTCFLKKTQEPKNVEPSLKHYWGKQDPLHWQSPRYLLVFSDWSFLSKWLPHHCRVISTLFSLIKTGLKGKVPCYYWFGHEPDLWPWELPWNIQFLTYIQSKCCKSKQ